MDVQLTVATLTAIASALLSLGLEYLPKVDVWYDSLTSKQKKQVMGVLLIVAALGAYFASCYTPFIVVACSEQGFWETIQTLATAFLMGGIPVSQGIHKLTKKEKE